MIQDNKVKKKKSEEENTDYQAVNMDLPNSQVSGVTLE